jgi:hypothetical protein
MKKQADRAACHKSLKLCDLRITADINANNVNA